jgi:hypothetical protein
MRFWFGAAAVCILRNIAYLCWRATGQRTRTNLTLNLVQAGKVALRMRLLNHL